LASSYPLLKINAVQTYAPGAISDAKFLPLLQNLTTQAPQVDVFFSLSFLNEGPTIIRLVRSLNWQAKVAAFTSPPSDANSYYVIGPDQWSPYLSSAFVDPLFGTAQNMNKEYLAAFPSTGESACTVYTAGATAGGYVLASAISLAGSTIQSEIVTALQNIGVPPKSFLTFYGNISFNIKGQNVAKEMIVTQVLKNIQGQLQATLVGPDEYAADKFVYPIPYGCNDSAACNYQNNVILNASCLYQKPCTSDGSYLMPVFHVLTVGVALIVLHLF